LNEPWIGIEECTHLDNVTSGRRDMDRVIGVGRPGSAATRADIFEQARDFLVTTIAGDCHRIVAIKFGIWVRTCVEQQPHGVQVAFARGEVDRLVISGQVGIALEQAMKRGRVAGNGGADCVPDIASAAGP
jgi:hypothetical protein